ncbi:MAG: hypothetical protein ABDH59_07415, partial [Fervidobacterium sp.]
EKLNISELSAISANLGTVTAGTLQGSTSTAKFDLNSEQITVATDKVKIGKGVLPDGSDGIYIKNANLYVEGGILGDHIASNTITSNKLFVSQLSSISANLGTINAGTINSVTINSSTINSSTINSTCLRVSSSSGCITFTDSLWSIADGGSSGGMYYLSLRYYGHDSVVFGANSSSFTARFRALFQPGDILMILTPSEPIDAAIGAGRYGEAKCMIRFKQFDAYSTYYYTQIEGQGVVIPANSSPIAPPTIPTGYMIYNTSQNRLWIWNGSAWKYVQFS